MHIISTFVYQVILPHKSTMLWMLSVSHWCLPARCLLPWFSLCWMREWYCVWMQALLYVPIVYFMVQFEADVEKFFFFYIVFFQALLMYTLFGQVLVYMTPTHQVAQVLSGGKCMELWAANIVMDSSRLLSIIHTSAACVHRCCPYDLDHSDHPPWLLVPWLCVLSGFPCGRAFRHFYNYGLTFFDDSLIHCLCIYSTVVALFWNVFNGFLIARSEMPVYWEWMNRITPTTYIIYGLTISQLGDNETPINAFGVETTVKRFLDDRFGYEFDFRWWCVVILFAFLIAFRLIAVAALKSFNFQKR